MTHRVVEAARKAVERHRGMGGLPEVLEALDELAGALPDPDETYHERAVLDAMAAVPEETLRRSLENTLHGDEHSRAPCRAELDRRAAAARRARRAAG